MGAATDCAAVGAGGLAQRHAHSPNTKAAANTPMSAGKPAKLGKIEAVTTPSKPKASRQATTRARCASLPPKRAPHDWWATVATLKAVLVTNKPPVAQANSAPVPATRTASGGNNNAHKPSHINTAETAAKAQTQWALRSKPRSHTRPIHGSMMASTARVPSKTAPKPAKGAPSTTA